MDGARNTRMAAATVEPSGTPRLRTLVGIALCFLALFGVVYLESLSHGDRVVIVGGPPDGSGSAGNGGGVLTAPPTSDPGSASPPTTFGPAAMQTDKETLLSIAQRHGVRVVIESPRTIRTRFDGYRKLASPAVCYDEEECEFLGRIATQLSPPECDRVVKRRTNKDATDLIIPEAAVAKARQFARSEIAEWFSARRSAIGGAGGGGSNSTTRDEAALLFPSAAARRTPFFPLYVHLRGLGGDRIAFDATGNVTFQTARNTSLLKGVPKRFDTLVKGLREATPEYVDEFSQRYRMDLGHVPAPVYSNNIELFKAMHVALVTNTRGSATVAAAKMGVDYLAYPVAREVFNGAWPISDAQDHATADAATAGHVLRTVDRTVRNVDAALPIDGLPEWTYYAQAKIAASQQLPPGRTCTNANIFVTFLPGYGLGAALRLGAVWLGHAMLTNRLFVIHPTWKRWTGLRFPPTANCAKLGFSCYFVPPAPCTWDDINPGNTSMVRNGARLRGRVDRILIRGESRSPDLRLRDAPSLLPPDVTEEMVQALTGLKYEFWAQRQLLRYLVRAMQPWAELVVLQEMYRAGFPWDAADTLDADVAPPVVEGLPDARAEKPTLASREHLAVRPVIATHYRNGDALYNNEVAPVLKCHQLDTSLTVAMVEETLWTLHDTLRRNATETQLTGPVAKPKDDKSPPSCLPRYFFSFDHFRAVRHAEAWLLESKARGLSQCVSAVGLRANVPVLDTNVSFRNIQDDARTLMHRKFGGGYVIRVSLGNLYLATAVDAWVNNDASNWAMIINELRFTSGQMRHKALYVDIKSFADASPRHVMQMFCNTVGPDTTWDRDKWLQMRADLRAVFANRTCPALAQTAAPPAPIRPTRGIRTAPSG